MSDYSSLIPVNVVTGFLGSGKTTLLASLLASPGLRETAVLVNELGEVGLDHHLLRQVNETTVLLENGCVCCTIRGDLREALRELLSGRERGSIPYFRRVVIETTGLADPVPVAHTLLAEPVIQHHFRLGNILTTVDAVNGREQLRRFEPSLKQVAVADRLVLTKTDIADPALLPELRETLRRINPSAPVVEMPPETPGKQTDGERLLVQDLYEPAWKSGEVRGWLKENGAFSAPTEGHLHGSAIHSFSLFFEQPLDWTAFGIWMTMLLHRHGQDLLRIKGMLNVAGVPTPVLINGVQHVVHPPSHLEEWPSGDRRSRIVFIVNGLSRGKIEASLAAFNALANPPAAAAVGGSR